MTSEKHKYSESTNVYLSKYYDELKTTIIPASQVAFSTCCAHGCRVGRQVAASGTVDAPSPTVTISLGNVGNRMKVVVLYSVVAASLVTRTALLVLAFCSVFCVTRCWALLSSRSQRWNSMRSLEVP